MRIIGGTFGGRSIPVNKKLEVRPTTNFAKEGLFNILNNNFEFEDLSVLELFSGSGNITFEFLSRGVKDVLAIDKNNACIRQLQSNAIHFNVDNLRTITSDVFSFLGNAGKDKFDVIFADPPYHSDNITQVHELVMFKDMLNAGGWLIIEHEKQKDLSSLKGFLQLRKYGHVNFSIFENPNS